MVPALIPSPRGWLVLLALAVGGCGGPAPPVRDAFFRLEPGITVSPSPHPPAGTLLVLPLGARGFLGGQPIVFRTLDAPLQAQRYDDLLWEQPPGRAIADDLVAVLRSARVFSFVVSISDRARADFLLSGDLTRFEHLPTDQPPRVVAELNLTMVGGRDRRTLFSRNYAGEEPTGAATPTAMASAFNRLTARLLADAVRDIQALAPGLAAGR